MSGSFGQSNSNMYNLSKLGHKNLATITYLVHICTYLVKCLAKLGSSFSYFHITLYYMLLLLISDKCVALLYMEDMI